MDARPTPASPGVGLFAVAYGSLMLYGAYLSFAEAKWPWFMPISLDAVASLASVVSDTFGAYTAGAIAGVFGLLFVLGGVIVLVPERKNV